MKVQIDIGHPAHVHYFKNFIRIMKTKGHEILVSARDKDIAIKLLEEENIDYFLRGKGGSTYLTKLKYLIEADHKLYRLAKNFKPNICLSFGSPYLAHASSILSIPHIAFSDTEHNRIKHAVNNPFSDVILTPIAYRGARFKKQIKFDGYMELCYLHPNHFKPNKNILKKLHLEDDEKFAIIRFVSWKALHDRNHRGFSIEQKIKVVTKLRNYCKIFISSESELPKTLEKYRFRLPVNEMHHVLAFSNLMYGESATMASESAILGVPAFFHDDTGRGYTDEEEKKYGLVFNYKGSSIEDQNKSLEKAIELITCNATKEIYKKKAKKLIMDKIDVTAFMVWFIENYPKSKIHIKNCPDYQYTFN
jgi:hypothetical protein